MLCHDSRPRKSTVPGTRNETSQRVVLFGTRMCEFRSFAAVGLYESAHVTMYDLFIPSLRTSDRGRIKIIRFVCVSCLCQRSRVPGYFDGLVNVERLPNSFIVLY